MAEREISRYHSLSEETLYVVELFTDIGLATCPLVVDVVTWSLVSLKRRNAVFQLAIRR